MMKKLVWLAVCLIIITGSVFGQAIDRRPYTSIDPFDYRLDEARAGMNSVRKFRSVVQYRGTSGTQYVFSSLDGGTTMSLNPKSRGEMPEPAQGQIVTIYFTATRRAVDMLELDEIDPGNTTEAGINVVKSRTTSSGISRGIYNQISLFDYLLDRETAQRGAVRRFSSTVFFSHQEGINFSFADREEGQEGRTLISFRVQKRFPSIAKNQRVTIYFTATRGTTDSLVIDDIVF